MTAFTLRTTFSAVAFSAAMLAGTAPVVASNDMEGNDGDARLVIYFTRHAEKQTVTSDPTVVDPTFVYPTTVDSTPWTSDLNTNGEIVFTNLVDGVSTGDIQVCGTSKCAEELSNQGEQRALLLADWFAGRGITEELDAVYATHKTRTQQTVMPTATAAGLGVTVLDEDVRDLPDDQLEMFPMSELNPESTTPSECATLQAIQNASANGFNTILIAGHSGTLYDIMGNGVGNCGELVGLGLDTGNTVPDVGELDRFPKDSKGKVRDFGDIWKVVIKRNGEVNFRFRVNLQQPERLTVDNVAR